MLSTPVSQAAQGDLWRFYRGRSMLTVFRPGDYLVLETVAFDQIRVGDVIVFRGRDADGETGAIVHRVIAISPEGLTTRGDTNPWPDGEPVTKENLLGRVVALQRGRRQHPVWGGRLGLEWARLIRIIRQVQRAVWQRLLRPLGHLPWGLLRASRLPLHLWRPTITRVRFAAKDGPVIKYICDGRAVARWWPSSNSFQCSRPYDLIIFKPEK